MTQLSNQTNQTSEKGMLQAAINWNLLSAKIDDDSVADFTNASGFAVKIVDTSGEALTVDLATATGDDIFGFIPISVKSNTYVAGDLLRIAFEGSVMYMEASAAIAKGALVEILPAGNKVVTRAAGTIIGRALNQATADGDLVKVLIFTK